MLRVENKKYKICDFVVAQTNSTAAISQYRDLSHFLVPLEVRRACVVKNPAGTMHLIRCIRYSVNVFKSVHLTACQSYLHDADVKSHSRLLFILTI